MADSNMQLNWTDEQWNKVRQVVYEEARKARVAGNVLPLYGPLEPDARFISNESLSDAAFAPGLKGRSISVKDADTLRLSTLQVEVFLRGAQVADPELTSALTAFRRAANIVARVEDEIIFRGQPRSGQRPPVIRKLGDKPISNPADEIGRVVGGQRTDGLLAPQDDGLPVPWRPASRTLASEKQRESEESERSEESEEWQESEGSHARHIVYVEHGDNELRTIGEALVTTISQAIMDLEERHHLGPFACILGHRYFNAVQTPVEKSMVLPQDRILPFLGGGALLRTSTLPEDVGLVIALGGQPIDLVVGTDISVKFLQVTLDPYYVFRVYEKIVLRVKQPDAIAVLMPAQFAEEAATETLDMPRSCSS